MPLIRLFFFDGLIITQETHARFRTPYDRAIHTLLVYVTIAMLPATAFAKTSTPNECLARVVRFDRNLELAEARALLCRGVLYIPMVLGSRAYQPILGLIEGLGAFPTYNGPTMTVSINQPGKLIRITPSGTAIAGPEVTDLTTFPEHLLVRNGGDIYIPLRFMLEKLETSHETGQVTRKPDGAFAVHVNITGDPTPQPT